MLFKLRPCIQNLCKCVLPAYTKSWLDRTNKRSFIVVGFSPKHFLASVFPTSEKFDSDLELEARMQKTDAHPCPPMNNNIAPMPTQNPWAWVGMDMDMGTGTWCSALLCCCSSSRSATHTKWELSGFTMFPKWFFHPTFQSFMMTFHKWTLGCIIYRTLFRWLAFRMN